MWFFHRHQSIGINKSSRIECIVHIMHMLVFCRCAETCADTIQATQMKTNTHAYCIGDAHIQHEPNDIDRLRVAAVCICVCVPFSLLGACGATHMTQHTHRAPKHAYICYYASSSSPLSSALLSYYMRVCLCRSPFFSGGMFCSQSFAYDADMCVCVSTPSCRCVCVHPL